MIVLKFAVRRCGNGSDVFDCNTIDGCRNICSSSNSSNSLRILLTKNSSFIWVFVSMTKAAAVIGAYFYISKGKLYISLIFYIVYLTAFSIPFYMLVCSL